MKDGIGDYIVHGDKDAVNPEKKGTKVAAHYPLTLGAGESRTIRLRLSDQPLGDPQKAIGELCGNAFEADLHDAAPGSRRVLCEHHSSRT